MVLRNRTIAEQDADIVAIVGIVDDKQFSSIPELVKVCCRHFLGRRQEPNSRSSAGGVNPISDMPQEPSFATTRWSNQHSDKDRVVAYQRFERSRFAAAADQLPRVVKQSAALKEGTEKLLACHPWSNLGFAQEFEALSSKEGVNQLALVSFGQ